jgi:hypothetical protein
LTQRGPRIRKTRKEAKIVDYRYYVRFVNDHEQARRDLKRGYSFSSYALFPTARDAKEFWSDMLQRPVLSSELGRCKHGYGLRLPGLCGFGPFETVEEAVDYALEHRGYNGVNWPAAAIYEGRYAGEADCGDGDMFVPERLVSFVKLAAE